MNPINNYPNILTPPSNDSSPKPTYFVASPGSSSFASPESNYGVPQQIYTSYLPMEGRDTAKLPTPTLHFVEEPSDRFRFRYRSEMAGAHGSLNGKTSDRSRKQTFPTVELRNCEQPAVIRCSIYQHNFTGPHAHRLIKKQGKDEIDDPHDVSVTQEESYRACFHSMGIIHTARKNVISEIYRKRKQLKEELVAQTEGQRRELTKKEELEIKGLAESESKSINLNIVCLRFDAFTESRNGILYPICQPLYSNGINNLKSALTGELKIVRMDHCTSPCTGGREIFLLVERVTKKNIKVRLFELDDNDDRIWEDEGKFSELDVHHQYAIVFKTPPYSRPDITSQVKVYIELVRPSDNTRSEPKEFAYTPSSKSYQPGSKRSRCSYSSYDSSNFGSDELPTTINQFVTPAVPNQLENPCENLDISVESLRRAMTDFNSEELNKLYATFSTDMKEIDMSAYTIPRVVAQSGDENMFVRMECSVDHDGPKMGTTGSQTIANRLYKIDSGQLRGGNLQTRRSEGSLELLKAKKIVDQLLSFVKTNPSDERCVQILNVYFNTPNETNALHTVIADNQTVPARFILKFMFNHKQFNLVNVRNSDSETPLHLAVRGHNSVIVNCLVKDHNCDLLLTDARCNTALHLAVATGASVEILEVLLSRENVSEYIDLTNTDGDSALIMAVKGKNLAALKLLCLRGADVNMRHKTNGYVPLRFAIQTDCPEIVRFLLSNQNLNALEADFNGFTVFQAAYQEACPEILELIKAYMSEHDYKLDLKEELLESMSDEEMETDVKSEPVESLENLYSNVKKFTPECLEEVSLFLNESGNWENLADLLDLSHCIRSGLIDTDQNVSKSLLSYAVEFHNATVLEIRNFLDALDEKEAVKVIDEMVGYQS